MKLRFVLPLVFVALANGVGAQDAQTTVSDGFGGGGFEWDAGSKFMYRFAPIVQDGLVLICGTVAFSSGNSQFTRLSLKALQEATVKSSRGRLMRDLRFFNVVSSANLSNELVGQTATCKATGLAMTEAEMGSVEVQFRDGSYRIRR